MKKNLSAHFTAITVFVALATCVHLQAQQPHYKLIDIGTFGGQASYVSGDGNGTSRVLSNQGTLTGSADTSTLDPFQTFCFNDDCLVSHTFQWRNGLMTDLGALKVGVSSTSTWISANGLIAGISENGKVDPLTGSPQARAVLWRNGHITNLGTLEGGHASFANAVNSRGQVVGAALNDTPDSNSMFGVGYQTRAFLWENGAMQDLGTLGTGTDAQALFMNEKGQVVGLSYIDSKTPSSFCNFPLVTNSFIWDSEHRMVDLGSFGGTCTIASAMNNHGQVVGESNASGNQSSPAFIWENGSFKPLGGSLGGDFSGAAAINDEGEAVGFAYLTNDTVNGPYHAALWKHIGDLTDLGTLGGDPCSFAPAINAKTQVVGISISDCTLQNSTFRPFLWMDGSLYDLNTLIPAGSPLYLQSVETINDRGEIAGSGVDANGDEHAFLLIPCPGNGTSDCQEEVAGAAAATKVLPLTQPPQIANPRNSVRQMLLHRLGFGRLLGGTPQKAPLNTALVTSAPNVALSPTSLAFSTQAIGTVSSTKIVVLKNTGTASLTISNIAITGTNAGNFAQTHTCGSSLSAAASCTISVRFKPTASGTRTAALSVTDNAAGSPQRVTLSGIGTTAKLSPTSLNFGAVAIGSTSSQNTITLTNVGTTTLTISGIAIAGANPGDFAQTHTCGTSLAAAATCNMSVKFKPSASGTRRAVLSLSDNAAGSPQTVALRGIGALSTTVTLSPTSLYLYCAFTFVLGPHWNCSPPQTVSVTDTGSATLYINDITTTGLLLSQTNNCRTSLGAKQSCGITVSVQPPRFPCTSGTYTGALAINDTGIGSPQKVTLTEDVHCP